MLSRMVIADLRRNKGVNSALVALMMLAALLASMAVSTIVSLTGAVDGLFQAARPAHLVQMHAGELDEQAIIDWAEQQPDVADVQIQQTTLVENARLWFADGWEGGGVQDAAFVVQNPRFDLLLDMHNQPLDVAPGHVAVPIYYQLRHDLEVGDIVRAGDVELTISSFLRDSQMNPALASSKRLLVNPADIGRIDGSVEYLIEFQLHDPARSSAVTDAYRAAGFPFSGVAVDMRIFRLMNLLTDGMVIGVVVLASVLLLAVAGLCLRFAFLTATQNDYREIGVLKAIGIPERRIRGTYLAKYGLLAGIACLAGYLLALPLAPLLTTNISRYNGTPPVGLATFLLPLLPAVAIFALLLAGCALLLRRFGQISAVEALRSGGQDGPATGRLRLHTSRVVPTHVRLGLMDVVASARSYLVTLLVFVVCAFIVIVPTNLYTSMGSPQMFTQLGLGETDVLVDLRDVDDQTADRFADISASLTADPRVAAHAALITTAVQAHDDSADEWTRLAVTNGDHTIIPLTYLHGAAPTSPDQIALSWSNATALKKNVGDALQVRSGEVVQELEVTGVYQDLTNGGLTAQAQLSIGTPLWYSLHIQLNEGVDAAALVAEWSTEFAPARVVDSAEFQRQTMGGTVSQLGLAAGASALVAAVLAGLMTALFTQLLVARDARQITISAALGAPRSGLRVQYLTRLWTVLATGVVLGTIAANVLGPLMMGLVMRSMGATRISFTVNPWLAYLAAPALLLAVVGVSTFLVTRTVRGGVVTQLAPE